MQNSALLTIYAPPDSKSSADAVVSKWLVIFGEVYSRENSPVLTEIWRRALADIEPELLERACEKTLKQCRFFPTPADIRAHIDQAEQVADQAEAEDAWAFALNYATRHYHPDLGVDRRASELPPKIDRAINAAGGLRWLWGCPEDQLQWAKKSFVVSLANSAELERVADLLPSGGEARKILRQWRAQSEQCAPRSLAPATAAVEAIPRDSPAPDPIRAERAVLRERFSQPEPRPPMTPAEFEARRELLRRQAARLLEGEKPGPRKLAQAAPAVELKALVSK